MQKIKFNYIDVHFSYTKKRELKKFIEFLFKEERKPLTIINYIFCSDNYLIEINRKFLQHDDYTDIITFDLSEPKQPIVGEIYISTKRVKENAEKFGVDFNSELRRVIIHGVLHLIGYKDKSKTEKALMRKKEDTYLSLWP